MSIFILLCSLFYCLHSTNLNIRINNRHNLTFLDTYHWLLTPNNRQQPTRARRAVAPPDFLVFGSMFVLRALALAFAISNTYPSLLDGPSALCRAIL
jgi:hypothetical protein